MDIRKYFKVIACENKEEKIEPKTIKVYTDGSAINNGQKNAYGGIGIFFSDNNIDNVSSPLKTNKITNNVAELLACKLAIDKIVKKPNYNNQSILICTDSEYLINCVEKWSSSWETNNWMRYTKGKMRPVKNVELIKNIKTYYNKYQITFKHIKSHKTEPKNKDSIEYIDWYGNMMADKFAIMGSKKNNND